MSAGKRSRAASFLRLLQLRMKRGFGQAACNRIPHFRGANALSSLLRLISNQAFRHGWSLAGCRLEFLAARIVVRNKEVLNFAY
jgi:hypothetical protein